MGNERNATYAKTQKIRKEKQFSSGDGSLRHDDFRDDSGSHIRRFDRRLNRSNGWRRSSTSFSRSNSPPQKGEKIFVFFLKMEVAQEEIIVNWNIETEIKNLTNHFNC